MAIKILLVEDDEDDYILIKSALGELPANQYSLTWAPSYEEGVAAFKSWEYDLCLLDFRLGAQTGLDFLNEVCGAECDHPIIVLTGVGDQQIDLEVMKAGASDYLIKPDLTPAKLERAARYALQLKQTIRVRVRLAVEAEARAAAEAANRAKDDYIAMISHELRTPLNAMLGWIKLLHSGKLDDAAFARGLETLERSARAQSQLIEDLLDFSRFISGKFKFHFGSANSAAILRAALAFAHPTAEAKQITLHLEADDEAVSVIEADAERLQQVFNNLLGNALKFTPEGGRVAVSLSAEPESVRIAVSDTGQGIEPDFLPRVFDSYRQGESQAPRKQHGLGLGLPIARYIIEAHGGTIAAASPGLGQGAVFTVTLPRAASHEKAESRL